MSIKHIISMILMSSIAFTACEKTTDEITRPDVFSGAFAIIDAPVRNELLNCGVDQNQFDRLLSLPQDKFDQDFKGGWRTIDYQENCHNAAAEMIKAYIVYANPSPPKQIGILRWHAGQTKASAGNYKEAISLFQGTYKPGNQHGIAWNLYVDATIAFLRNDLTALTQAHDSLAKIPVTEDEKESRRRFLKENPNIKMPDGFVDKPDNLAPVESLLSCFGMPYVEAYGNCKR